MHSKSILSFLMLVLIVGCKYQREEDCTLDKLQVKGNVTKIETLVESTMPLTEMYYDCFDPSKAITMLNGNFVFEFDNYGYLDKATGYGVDKQILFEVSKFSYGEEPHMTPIVLASPQSNQISRTEVVSIKDGNIKNVKYYSDDKLIWNEFISYNENEEPSEIIKEYSSFSLKIGDSTIEYADTTRYCYSDLDEHGNWTVATVEYIGVLPKHQHKFKVLRQISYDGEPSKLPLIEVNDNLAFDSPKSTEFKEIRLEGYGAILIPKYLLLQSNKYIASINEYNSGSNKLDYLFMSTYDNNEAYASFSISKNYIGDENMLDYLTSEQLSYSKELDKELEESLTQFLASDGTIILKWLPYEIIELSDYRALKMRYYRYGKGNPIPVYCENYTIPMNDGYSLCITTGYQSNLDNKFRKDFSRAINSIRLK